MIHFLRSRNESSTLSLITVYTLLVHLDLRSSDKTVSYYKMQYLLFKPYQLFTYLGLSFREEHKPTMTIFSTVCVVSYFCEPLVQYVIFFRFVIFCNRILFYKTKLQAPTLKFRLNTRNSNSSRQKTNLRKGKICCEFVQFNSERLEFSIYD